MAKVTGLGDNLYIAGYDISGDVGALGKVSGSHAVKEVTCIDKYAVERLALTRDGEIGFTGWFDTATGAIHAALNSLPSTDVLLTYARGTTRGSPAACVIAKQASYDVNREVGGALSVACQGVGNGAGLDWGLQLTAGKETIAGAGNSTGVDFGMADSIGTVPVATIASTSNSVANPTSILFPSLHGLVSGDSINVSGQASGTPLINGDFQATFVDTTHVTVPVNVTVIGGSATIAKTSTDYGAAMYVQVFAVPSNSITIKVQTSADNGASDAFVDVAGLTTTAISGQSAGLRIVSTSSTAIIRRYARIVTSGTFSNAVVNVVLVRYGASGS